MVIFCMDGIFLMMEKFEYFNIILETLQDVIFEQYHLRILKLICI